MSLNYFDLFYVIKRERIKSSVLFTFLEFIPPHGDHLYYSVWYMKNPRAEVTALPQGTCNLIKAYETAFSDLSGAVPPFLTIYLCAVS